VSKRHQASRRKTYGRRQHEVRERRHRDLAVLDLATHEDYSASTAMPDRISFFDPRTPRLRFAIGD
jgi:hypothetical protein